jgi:hypothetical protein
MIGGGSLSLAGIDCTRFDKRLVKKQQTRWTPTGAHRLLQVRARVLNQQLRGDFERWHPELRSPSDRARLAA